MVLHPRIVLQFFFAGLRLKIVKQIDIIRVVQLKPVGYRGDGAPASLGQRGHDLFPQLRVGDFADAHHATMLALHRLRRTARK
jgi:hypothetical protein